MFQTGVAGPGETALIIEASESLASPPEPPRFRSRTSGDILEASGGVFDEPRSGLEQDQSAFDNADTYETSKGLNNAARIYVRDTKAQASTAVDLKEIPKAFMFICDMPGLKSSDIAVQVENENENVLTIGGERMRDELSEYTKYLQLDRSAAKFLWKFTLPSNADLGDISASATDGVLTVNVPKLHPPKPKVTDVMVG